MDLSAQPFNAFHPALHHHDDEVCPMCEQIIPNDRLEQVKARHAQHQREVESQYALRLKSDREQLMAEFGQQNDEALGKLRLEAAEREAAARAEERKAVTAEADAKIASAAAALESMRSQSDELKRQLEAAAAATTEKVNAAREAARQQAEAALQPQLAAAQAASAQAQAQARAGSEREEAALARISQLTQDVTAAHEAGRKAAETELRSQADDLQRQLDASVAATDEKVNAAREAARKEAEGTLQPQLVAAQATAQQAQEQARQLAEREAAARAQVNQLTQDVVAAREEGRKAGDAEVRLQLNAVNEEKQAAITAKAVAEQQLQALRESQDKTVRDAITETREALEKSHRDTLNAEQAKHFEDKQKFQNTVDDLKRQLENKTALELGEGAEVDLFEALKEAFPGDDITRIKRGVAGADIRHMVRHNGKDCGLILYDAKNHKAWRNDFVTKLRDDQIAAKADHAILATIAFPQGARQLHVQDGVVLVNPARAVVIAEVVRRHIVQAHSLNLSNDDREKKSLELYGFIMSERFGALMTKLRATTDSLIELEAKEQNAHKLVWQKRGQLIGSVAKAEADVRSEIDRIIGTADAADDGGLAGLLVDAAGTSAGR